MKYSSYKGATYKPITPQPDTPELAAKGKRLMLRHWPELEIFWADKDVLTAGWVIGVE